MNYHARTLNPDLFEVHSTGYIRAVIIGVTLGVLLALAI